MQNPVDGQETACRLTPDLIVCGAVHVAPPLMDASNVPFSPTEMQNEDDGHDMPPMSSELDTWFIVTGPDHVPPL